jgi:ribosome-associated protein
LRKVILLIVITMSELTSFNVQQLHQEVEFTTSRSSGPGGQNVNKVNSKVTLKFDVIKSQLLTQDQRELILEKLNSKLTTDGVLLLSSQEKRTQLQNKEATLEKFDKIIAKVFEKRKKRKPTKPSKSSVQKRINEKQQHSEKKQWRQKL